VTDPDGRRFTVVDAKANGDPMHSIMLACTDLKATTGLFSYETLKILHYTDYWTSVCGLTLLDCNDAEARLQMANNGCILHFVKRNSVVAGSGFGRVAFSCAAAELPDIEAKAKVKDTTVLTPLVSLDTPGESFVIKSLQLQTIKTMCRQSDCTSGHTGGSNRP
jgi:hypothetical protein